MLSPVIFAHDASNPANLYKVDVATGDILSKVRTKTRLYDIAFDPAGNLYGIDDSRNLYKINQFDGEIISRVQINTSDNLNSLVFSPDGKLYAAGSRLFLIEPGNGNFVEYKAFGSGIVSAGDLAFDKSGDMYLTTTRGSLAKIDTNSGAATIVGDGIIGFSDIFALAFGPDDVMYGMSNKTYDIFTIDTSTGKGTKKSNFSGKGVVGVGGSSFIGESAVSVSVLDASRVEGDTGSETLEFTVKLSRSSSKPVSVSYGTVQGSAAEQIDYYGMNVVLTFEPGETEKKARVFIAGDTEPEPDESFQVVLSSPYGAVIDRGIATGTILNDDAIAPAGDLSFGSVTYTVGENGGQVLVTVIRANGSSGQVGCLVRTLDSSAVAGQDYQSVSTWVYFADGDSAAKSIAIPIYDDVLVESPESFQVRMTDTVGGARTVNPDVTTVNISDNDANPTPLPVPSAWFTANEYQVKENGVRGKITLQLSNSYDQDYYVRIRTRQLDRRARKGIARENVDYFGFDTVVRFAPGQTSMDVFVDLKEDNITEGDERLGLELLDTGTGRVVRTARLKIIDTRKPRRWPFR